MGGSREAFGKGSRVLPPPTPVSPGVFRGRERKKEGAGQGLVGRRCSPGPWLGVTSDLLRRDEHQMGPPA